VISVPPLDRLCVTGLRVCVGKGNWAEGAA
jgi:hypothetical protein